jgi:hypothetical protein
VRQLRIVVAVLRRLGGQLSIVHFDLLGIHSASLSPGQERDV